jgi:hypothetical protein
MVSVEAAVGQNQSNTPPYQVWVDRTGGTTVTGILNQVAQDHIQVIPGFYIDQGKPGDTPHLNISYQEIQQLRLRRKGKVGRGIMIGAAVGAVTGVIIGLASSDDPDCGYDPNSPSLLVHFVGTVCEATSMTAAQKAVLAGTGLGLAGGLVGGILGSIKIKIPINGSQNIFEANRPRLEGYTRSNY